MFQTSLTERSLSALFWGYAGYAGRAVISFGYTLVLARLLGPKPFGQVAVAWLVIGFANLLADGGFELALVQAPELTEGEIRFVFTIQLAIGSVLMITCIAIAPIIATVFRDPAVTTVLRWMSLVFILQSLGQVSTALLKRRLDFRWLQGARVGSSLAGYAGVGTLLAVLGSGVWSLIIAQLVQSAAYSVTVFSRVRHDIRPSLSSRNLRLARFGATVATTNVLNWGISNFDNLFAGRSFGSVALGLYSRAFNTTSVAADGVIGSLQQVLVASCSRASGRPRAVQRAYLASLAVISLVTVPVFCAVAVSARTVAIGLYGPTWSGLTPLMAPLALSMVFHAGMALAGPVLSALDRVVFELKAQLAALIIAVPAFLIAARYSLTILAWAVFGVYCFRFFTTTLPVVRILGLEWRRLFKAAQGGLFLGSLVTLAVWTANVAVTKEGMAPAGALMIVIATGSTVSIITVLLAIHHLLSPELLEFLEQASPSLPAKVLRIVRVIGNRCRQRTARVSALSSQSGQEPPDACFVIPKTEKIVHLG